MLKTITYWLLVVFVLGDLAFSCAQHYQMPLEKDLVDIVLPSPECQQVLHDPFGWAVLTRNEVYVAPNRFFAHAVLVAYFQTVPLWLQRYLDPISSVYAACALFKTVLQAVLLYVLAMYCSGTYRLSQRRLWVAAALLVPLFQVGGYQMQMAIIDHSITYTVFYAFSLTLLLLWLLPFYQAARRGQPLRLGWAQCGALALLMVVLAFNAPVVIGTVGVIFIGILGRWLARNGQYVLAQPAGQRLAAAGARVPWQAAGLLAGFGVLCLYSLYIGRNEAENVGQVLPLAERYQRLPLGVFKQLTVKLGLPLLLALVLLNMRLLRRYFPQAPESRRLRHLGRWLAGFALVYVLLLPLGGYRDYRPLILRRDSVLPIVLGLVVCYGSSTLYLLGHLPGRPRRWYLGAVLLASGIYLQVDKLRISPEDNNACERRALEELARTPGPVVPLPADCTVLSFHLMPDYHESENAARMLYYWHITNEVKLYYQRPTDGWGRPLP